MGSIKVNESKLKSDMQLKMDEYSWWTFSGFNGVGLGMESQCCELKRGHVG